MFNLKFKIMKKMYWILLLLCGALAFPACSDNDNSGDPAPDPEPEPEVPGVVYKQVKQITEVGGDWDDEGNQIDRVITLKYDADGKLSEAIATDAAGSTYAYTDTKVTRSGDSYVDGTEETVYPEKVEWILKSGVAESLKYTSRTSTNEGDDIPEYKNCILTYAADGYLSTVETTNGEAEDESSETFTFDAGNLTKYTYIEGDKSSDFDEYEYTFTQYKHENKANIDLFYYLDCFENDFTEETLLLNLVGKRSAKLPEKMDIKNTYSYDGDEPTVDLSTYTFKYEADAEGYITKLTVFEDEEEYAVYVIKY